MTYVRSIVDGDYEILNVEPFTIRRISDKFVPKQAKIDKSTGYVYVYMNAVKYQKHRVIAFQFIPNDDPKNKTFVDHRNGRRYDNRLSNLRWVTPKKNNENIHSANGIDYEFVDELEANSIAIKHASQWYFSGYYICNNKVLKIQDDKYRILLKHESGNQWIVNMNDNDGVQRKISKNQLEEACNYVFTD